MLKVGITGGIGSGKSTVCKIFETLGIPVYYADERAKWLMHHNAEVATALSALFGPDTFMSDGQLNRAWIASIVFKDREQLSRLNAIVHPAVAEDYTQWQSQFTTLPYTLKEAALLFESGSYLQLDKIITVFASKETRIKRVMERDGVDRQSVEDRISKQMSDEKKKELANFIIDNEGHHLLLPQVLKIHEALCN